VKPSSGTLRVTNPARQSRRGLQTPIQCLLRVRENQVVSTGSSTREASARHLDVD
jgi:hypothetical protein